MSYRASMLALIVWAVAAVAQVTAAFAEPVLTDMCFSGNDLLNFAAINHADLWVHANEGDEILGVTLDMLSGQSHIYVSTPNGFCWVDEGVSV